MIKPYTELPRLTGEREAGYVPLVPNTGIQFLDVPLPLGNVKLNRAWFELPRVDGLAALKPLATDEEEHGFYFLADGRRSDVSKEDPGFCQLDMKAALLPFLGKWVPVPYLQIHTPGPPGRRRLEPGPQNWARLYIVELKEKEAEGNTHRAVLAFDTATATLDSDGGFLQPRDSEPERFALATRMEEVAWLLDKPWMRGWLDDLYRERDSGGRPLAPDVEIGCRHFAAYLTLLAALEESGVFPLVRLIDLTPFQRHPNSYVNVDLVLDLGNSRSCGFLIEQSASRERSIADSYRLLLRDLSAPESVSDLPFASQIEFARAAFGREERSLESCRAVAFDWPSPVRVGPEAVRLSSLSRGNEGQTGLSSPKRYLWDDKARLSPWRFNSSTDSDGVIRGSYLKYLGVDGTVLSMKRQVGIATRSVFSRASLFTLFLLEVLLHARAQVNSYAARFGRQDMGAPRRITNLILTLPPAMPLEEVRIVRERAKAAAHLLRDVSGESVLIAVEAKLDEATATQIVYLYDQVSHSFRGDAPDYFALAGRPRSVAGKPKQPTLRVASIDVGGGTTDLAIYTYSLNDRVVMPEEEFREGFRIAGDDVLELVLMRHVMPGLRRALADTEVGGQRFGTERAEQLLVSLFRVPAGTEPERQARRLVLNHVLAPAALAILTDYESWSPMSAGGVERRTIGQLLTARVPGLTAVQPDQRGRAREPAGLRAAAWLNGKLAEHGIAGFVTESVAIDLDFAAVHDTVKQTLQPALEPLCEIIHRFGCDVLLLSGRAVRWPAVPDLVIASMAIEPHRVQPMHKYRVGAWYPFADGTGRIFDPKTTVAVGAMLHRLLHGGQLDNLAMADKFGIKSTARYVGLMENDRRIRADRILFTGTETEEREEQSATVTFSGRSLIGFKQFRAERWPASPLYRLELAQDKAAGLKLPLTLTVVRKVTSNEEGEAMEIDIDPGSERNARGDPLLPRTVVRSLQTLSGDEASHWLDAGQLALLDSILAAIPDRV